VKRKLPYKGEILVTEGDSVRPEDIVAVNRYQPPKLYVIDIQRHVGYNRLLTEEEFQNGIMVKEGDKLKIDDLVFHLRSRSLTKHEVFYYAPVRGIVESLDKKTKIIIMREIQDYDGETHVVNVAKYLTVNPKSIKRFLRFNLGEFIGYGRVIAPILFSQGPGLVADENLTGTLKEINTKKGTITIQYELNPVTLNAFVKGTVSKVVENACVWISGKGSILYGIIGFGGEAFGELIWLGDADEFNYHFKDKVLAVGTKVDQEFLRKAAEVGVAGIIAPSIHNSDWVKYYGKEIGVAVTGDEEIPFTLILTEGFGEFDMNEKNRKFFVNADGKLASISGRTQIRAGVTRPMVIISD